MRSDFHSDLLVGTSSIARDWMTSHLRSGLGAGVGRCEDGGGTGVTCGGDVGRCLGVGCDLGVGVTLGVALGVSVGVAVAVGVPLGLPVAVGVGVGVGPACAQYLPPLPV